MDKRKTKAAPGAKTGAAQMKKQQGKFSDNSAHSQRMRLLQKLRECNLTTSEARRELDIMHPAARVQELRDMGLVINTVWTSEKTTTGRTRHLARYVLVREVCHE